jgi:hypothetical protein
MRNADNFQIEFEKIILKNPLMDFNNRITVSSILLFRDYLTRLKSWKVVLGVEDFFINVNSFHNLFLNVSGDWKNELPSQEEFFNWVTNQGFSEFHFSKNSLNGMFIYLYICWSVTKHENQFKNHNFLAEPYESVMKIIEANHLIHRSEGHFHIHNNIYLRRGGDKFLLPSLDENFLKYIDTQCPVIDWTVLNVPEQEEINKLWENFKGFNINQK